MTCKYNVQTVLLCTTTLHSIYIVYYVQIVQRRNHKTVYKSATKDSGDSSRKDRAAVWLMDPLAKAPV